MPILPRPAQTMYLWVGKGVAPDVCLQLFDVPNYHALPPVQGGQHSHLVSVGRCFCIFR